jgi:hypothetical protein
MTSIDIYRPGSPPSLQASVNIDDRTLFQKKLMGEHQIVSEFISTSVLSIQILDYIVYNTETYTINKLPNIEKINNTTYKYKIVFESDIAELNKKLYISSDGLADFPLNGTAEDFIDLLITNINSISSGWTKGTVDTADPQTLQFANETCRAALSKVAEAFNMEFSLSGKALSLQNSVGTTTDYTFQYGKGLGLYKLERQQISNQNIITRCYGFGGTKNIPSSYRTRAKRLVFESVGVRYLEKNTSLYGTIEGQYTNDNIYPQRTSTLTDVNMVFDAGASGTDFNPRTSYIEDTAIDFDLNDYLIEGLVAKVVFKSGDLAGVTCEIWKYNAANKRIYINPYTDPDGYTMPLYNSGSPVIPNTGDTYTLVDMKMPDAYVTAAETALQAATQAYLDEMSVPQVVYSVEIDPKYAASISLDLNAGDRVTIIDSALGINSMIRVSAVEFPLVNPNQIKATIADFVPYTQQERVIKTTSDNKKNLHTVNKNAEELARLNSLRLHQEKAKSTVPMYQGVYVPGTTYYGNPSRIDIVKYNIPDDDPDAGEIYYIARVDAPSESFSGIAPTNTDYWKKFDAQYSSLATQLFFAELAYIDNLGVKYFNGVPVPVGDLAGTVTNVQPNIALSAAWEPDFFYNTGDKCSNDGTNYVASEPNVGQEPPTGPWNQDPIQPQKRIDKVTLTGTSGAANITCDGLTKQAVWNVNGLAPTAADFVVLFAANWTSGGVVLTSVGNELFFESAEAGTDFSGNTYISNVPNVLLGTIKIQGNEIWEDDMDNDTQGSLSINRKGYNGGPSRYRHLFIGNGKNSWIAYFRGQAGGDQIYLNATTIEMPNIPHSSPGGDAIWVDGSGYLRKG